MNGPAPFHQRQLFFVSHYRLKPDVLRPRFRKTDTMAGLLKRILLTLIALVVLVIVHESFGTISAVVVVGVGFLLYIFWITLRQMRDDDSD